MTESFVINVVKTSVTYTIILSAPMLGISLIVGLIISIFQTTTSIQEQTLTFVPKIISVFAVMLWGAGWLVNIMMKFTNLIFDMMVQVVK